MKIEPLPGDFLKKLHVAAYVQDHEGRVIFMNPAATRLTGWRLAEVVGRRGHDIFGGSQVCPCRACQGFDGFATGLPDGVLEGTIRTRAGVWRPVRVGVSPFAVGTGEVGTLVMIEDLTPKCPVKAAKPPAGGHSSGHVGPVDLERFVDGLFEAIPDGISILDPDLTVRRVNPFMAALYRDRMPLVGRRCYECYQARIGPCFPCPSLRCLQSGKVEHEIVPGPAGSPVQRLSLISFPLRDPASGEIRQVIEFVRDISATAHLENGRCLVAEAADRARSLRQAVEVMTAPEAAAAEDARESCRSQADALVAFCDQILAQWPEAKASSGKPTPG